MTLGKRFVFLVGVMFFSYCWAGVSFAEDMVCGKLNGHVIEVSRKYIVFWPEYEGKSSWEKGFIHNKEGCDANLVSLPMIMTWPGMTPANHTTYFLQNPEFEGLGIHLEPLTRPNGDLRYRLERYLEKTSSEDAKRVSFLSELGLYFVRGNDRTFTQNLNGYYWYEEGGEVPIVFECLWSGPEYRYYVCEGAFVSVEAESLVEITFTPEKLQEWKEIVVATKNFILSGLK